jgi:hypothetical protein
LRTQGAAVLFLEVVGRGAAHVIAAVEVHADHRIALEVAADARARAGDHHHLALQHPVRAHAWTPGNAALAHRVIKSIR